MIATTDYEARFEQGVPAPFNCPSFKCVCSMYMFIYIYIYLCKEPTYDVYMYSCQKLVVSR